MKRYLRIIVLITIPTLFFSSCVENNNKGIKIKVEEKISHENFDWLLGNWKRNFEEEGKETFEIWGKNSSSEYSGIGFTISCNFLYLSINGISKSISLSRYTTSNK